MKNPKTTLNSKSTPPLLFILTSAGHFLLTLVHSLFGHGQAIGKIHSISRLLDYSTSGTLGPRVLIFLVQLVLSP